MLNRDLRVIYRLLVYIMMVLGVSSNAEAQGVMAKPFSDLFKLFLIHEVYLLSIPLLVSLRLFVGTAKETR